MTERRENIARALWEAERLTSTHPATSERLDRLWNASARVRDHYRRLADAAIAADDGAVGRVLALAQEFDVATQSPLINDFDRGLVAGYAHAADRIRDAVGAPATAEDGEP